MTQTSVPEAPASAARDVTAAGPRPDPIVLAGRTFTSRLIVGTGKYTTFPLMKQALEESGAEIVTVAVRRVNLTDRGQGVASRLPPHGHDDPAEHGRLLQRGRRRARPRVSAAKSACPTG